MTLKPRALPILAAVSATCVAVALVPDVVNNLVRLGMAAGIVGLSAVLVILAARRSTAARAVLGVVLFLVAVVAWSPTRASPTRAAPHGSELLQAELRRSFVEALRRYEGVDYVWGGEGGTGIDCSGLLRRAWRDALVERGVRGDPALLREALSSWWFDETARDLRDGVETEKVGTVKTVRGLAREQRTPGDLLVTTDGTHIMAFLDDGTVIEADPMTMKVMILDDRRDTHRDTPWLDIPLHVVRWPELGHGR